MADITIVQSYYTNDSFDGEFREMITGFEPGQKCVAADHIVPVKEYQNEIYDGYKFIPEVLIVSDNSVENIIEVRHDRAKWVPNVNADFVSDIHNGSLLKRVRVSSGSTAPQLLALAPETVPAKEGYEPDGWQEPIIDPHGNFKIAVNYVPEGTRLVCQPHSPAKYLPRHSFVDASAFQALIDKIAATRKALKESDNAVVGSVTDTLNELRNELITALNTVKDSIEANTAADLAQAAEQAALKAQSDTNKSNIEDLQALDHLIKTDFDTFKAEYELYKTSVTEQLDEIIAALQVVVSVKDVEDAMVVTN